MGKRGPNILNSKTGKKEIALLKAGYTYKEVKEKLNLPNINSITSRNNTHYKIDLKKAFRERIEKNGIPNNLDISDSFGRYFSAFFDGEGCFIISYYKCSWNKIRNNKKEYYTFLVSVRVGLRDDDQHLLYYFQKIFGGSIQSDFYQRKQRSPSNRNKVWSVSNIKTLAEIFVPLFVQYPLYTKKAKEFEIWKNLIIEKYILTRGGHDKQGTGTPEFTKKFMEGTYKIQKEIRKYTGPSNEIIKNI